MLDALSSLLGGGLVPVAKTEIDAWLPANRSNVGSSLAQVRVSTSTLPREIQLSQVLYLTTALLAEYSFFHLTGSLRSSLHDSWAELLAHPPEPRSPQPDARFIAHIIATLQFGAAPVLTTNVKLASSEPPAHRAFAETPLAFYAWVHAALDANWRSRLRDTMDFALEKWRLATPSSTASTWKWLQWIDYPSWIQQATGAFTVGRRKPLYTYASYAHELFGISVQYPDYMTPAIHNSDTGQAVLFAARPGHPDLQVFKDRGRFFTISPDLSPPEYILRTYEDMAPQCQKEEMELVIERPPTGTRLSGADASQAEFVSLKHGEHVARIHIAAARLNTSQYGGLTLFSPANQAWMRRDMFDRIRASVRFL